MMPEFNTNDPVEELKSARALFGHSKTYMKCLENAVTSMDDNERFVTYLVELGRRHQVRPLKAHYLDVSRLSLLTGFPFSQFIRPGRLCSDDSDFFDKSVTMCQFFRKTWLVARLNDKNRIPRPKIDRQSALQTAQKENTDRMPFTLTFHPQNHAFKFIILENLKLSENDSKTGTIFSQPLLISFKREN